MSKQIFPETNMSEESEFDPLTCLYRISDVAEEIREHLLTLESKEQTQTQEYVILKGVYDNLSQSMSKLTIYSVLTGNVHVNSTGV